MIQASVCEASRVALTCRSFAPASPPQYASARHLSLFPSAAATSAALSSSGSGRAGGVLSSAGCAPAALPSSNRSIASALRSRKGRKHVPRCEHDNGQREFGSGQPPSCLDARRIERSWPTAQCRGGFAFAQRPIGGHAGVRKTSEPAGKSGKFELFIAYWRTFAGVRKPGARSQQSGACRRATPPCRRSHSRRQAFFDSGAASPAREPELGGEQRLGDPAGEALRI